MWQSEDIVHYIVVYGIFKVMKWKMTVDKRLDVIFFFSYSLFQQNKKMSVVINQSLVAGLEMEFHNKCCFFSV